MKNKQFSQEILQEIKILQRADNWRNFLYIFCDYGLIFIAIVLCKTHSSIFTYLLAILLIGSRMRAFDNLTHESSHKMLFKNTHLNRWIATLLCAFPVGTSVSTYWKSHIEHHKYLGNAERDPDLKRYKLLGVDKFPIPRKEMIFHLFSVFTLIHVPSYLFGTLKSFVFSNNVRFDEIIVRWLFLGITFTLLIASNLWYDFFLFWVIPFLSSFQILRYLSEISEHGGLYHSDCVIEITRNNICHPMVRFIMYPHSDFYHLVHHLFPAIPHYNLDRAHQLLMEDSGYQKAHHCYGYFKSTYPGQKSTLDEMILEASSS